MNIKKLIGKRIKEIRKYRNLTQEALAEITGMDTSSISHIENGKYYPTAENLDRIMNALEVKPSDVFNIESLDNTEVLIQEMNEAMKNNKKLARAMYNFYSAAKFFMN